MSRAPRTREVGNPRGTLVPLMMVLGIFLVLPGAGGSTSVPTRPPEMAARAVSDSALALRVVPDQWWMPGGTQSAFAGVWIGVPPGCAVHSLWFRWAVGPGSPVGTLNETNGSVVGFRSGDDLSGRTQLRATGAAALACGPGYRSAFRSAAANVTVDARPALRDLHLGVDGAASSDRPTVAGFLLGGLPPYTLEVDWGSGQETATSAASPGNFTIPGPTTLGPLDPSIVVTDSAGLTARGTVPENGSGNAGFSIGLVPSTYQAAVGIPVEFRLTGTLPPADFTFAAACEDSAPPSFESRGDSSDLFACTFANPGNAFVSVTAVECSFPFRTAEVQLSEPVASALSIRAGVVPQDGEVGRVAEVPFAIAGGVPPFRIHWWFAGNGTAATESVEVDGTVLLQVVPSIPGAESVVAQVADSLGEVTENATVPLRIDAPLEAEVAESSEPQPNGTVATVSGGILGGVPPFDWVTVADSFLYGNESFGGYLVQDGTFHWDAETREEGIVALTTRVVDAVGTVWSAVTSAAGLPRLNLSVNLSETHPGGWHAQVDVTGGAPPFSLWLNDSSGHSWNRSSASDRGWSVTSPTGGPGVESVSVTVLDHLGFRAEASAHVELPRPASPVDPTRTVGVAAGALLAAALGIGVVTRSWRRRAERTEPPAPDATDVLRRIISPSDGIDRSLAEMLAEEEGVDSTRVHAALDDLIERGVVLAERGADGEEILAWGPGA